MLEQIIGYGSSNLKILLSIIKLFFIFMYSYFTSFKIINKKIQVSIKNIIKFLVVILISAFCAIMRFQIDYFTSIFCWIFIMAFIIDQKNLKRGLFILIVSLGINYIVSFLSIVVDFIINIVFDTNGNNELNLIIILIIHFIIIMNIFSIKKFKYGIAFLKNDSKQNEYIDILILDILLIIIFGTIILSDSSLFVVKKLMLMFIMLTVTILNTIQKSLQLYYKQKMLIKDLIETKEELENKKKEIEELETENIRISKKNHTIVHKQKSIEHKLEEMLIKSEISIEEAGEVKERLEKLHTQIYSEKENTELDKTGISGIDDMLNYMQSECTKNKIEFTLVIKENIHYMVNNLISKEDLETLIADHIKDAIIAINHTDNINRSILVKLGNIDGIYSLYIYDSGVEFKKEVLKNLGIKPFTTYESEGGTGMGFMNTFDTLRKYKASLIIEEFNEPKPDNYTKLIAIKFDNNNKFEIKSYRKIEIKKKI